MPHADPVQRQVYQKAYWTKIKDRWNARRRQARAADPGAARAQDRAAYMRKDKAKKRAAERRRYARNRSQESARKQAFYTKNRDVFFERSRRRRAQQARAAINDLTAAQWREIKAAYDYRCVYCRRKTVALQMDHIQPLSQGGNHTAMNIVPACKPCNVRKADGPPLRPVQPLLLTLAKPRQGDAYA